MEVNMEKIKFKRIIGVRGDSLGMTIPKELLDYLSIKEGDEVTLTPDEGKHGKFAAIFKEEKR